MSTESPAPVTADPSVAGRPGIGRRLVAASLLMLLLGLAAGLVWVQLARPAQWEVRDGGIVLTEAASRGQFSVIVLFVAIGVLTSMLWGWGTTWALPDLGWLVIPVVVVLTTLAAVIAWRVGVELGPPPPTSVTAATVGDRIPAQLSVDGVAPFLTWPIFGLVGVIGATWVAGRARDRAAA
ncbi:MAG: hypothetical protein ABW075_01525 [Aeromicrobium sp.]